MRQGAQCPLNFNFPPGFSLCTHSQWSVLRVLTKPWDICYASLTPVRQPAGRARGTVHCEFKCSDYLDNVQYISCECSVQNLHTILIFMICLTTSIILWLDKSWNCQHCEEIRKGKFCSSWCVRGERRNLISNFNFSKVRWMLVWCPRMTKVKSS